ncbi:hypothetical protein NX862_14720 [Rhodobacter sp. KR11]|uniref:EF-hand domain-containing protein n=1 Tax=Rhodobacter sp. KR11 TaxID=2974588 RepID=UPI0022215E37|nr:hypothetical protein [Rhodobacter sp. KR11]MCW1920011.1 hypothetical protein [Rhodobacter sp. KR11]
MISALSGSSALTLLSVFGRGQAASGVQETRAAARPPPPPPPPPAGNGASAQSIFESLLGSVDTKDLIAGLDQDGDGTLGTEELTSAFQQATGDPLAQLVSNIIANLDGDGDQAVNADELTSGLEQLAASGPQGHPGGPPPGPPPTDASDAATSLINGLDSDGDGTLSAEELAAAFETKSTATANAQKSLQELLFTLLLEGKDQQNPATSAYAA